MRAQCQGRRVHEAFRFEISFIVHQRFKDSLPPLHTERDRSSSAGRLLGVFVGLAARRQSFLFFGLNVPESASDPHEFVAYVTLRVHPATLLQALYYGT